MDKSGGRVKNTVPGSGRVSRRGSGLGTGPVGNGGGFSGRPGSSGSYGSGSKGGFHIPFGFPGGFLVPGGRSGCLSVILLLLLLLFISGIFFRGCFGYTDQAGQEQEWTQGAQQTVPSVSERPESTYGSAEQGLSNRNGILNEEVRTGSRIKYTDTGHAETATVLVYICGSNLESENGMATSDLKEMIGAGLGEDDPVKLIVYTGGAKRWKNNAVSSRTNQVYRVYGEGLECLVKDDGDKAMTEPDTLASFIQYAAKAFPADRTMLILWDHGAGSVLGYGHDEKHSSAGYMSLAKIKDALETAGTRFDFVGFDACLMSSLSSGCMLSGYADYMIASEETEPGTGWYYTGWLQALNRNPKIPTAELGKIIADDFTEASARYQRGADTTLSVTDLAELQTFAPEAFRKFSESMNGLLASENYRTVSDARAGTKEFAASEKLDQVDLVHLALNMGTPEGEELAGILQSAVKYNRTSRGYDKAYGLSEYFPYRSASRVDSAVENFDSIGMEESYASTIRTFANMQLSGQIASGGSSGSFGSLFGSLFGGNGYGYAGYGDYSGYGTYQQGVDHSGYAGGSSQADSYFGNAYDAAGSVDPGTVLELLELFGERSSVAGVSSGNRGFVDTALMKEFVPYVSANSINPTHLKWKEKGSSRVLAFDDTDWAASETVLLSVFVDDGNGFIDLGLDNVYRFDEDGDLVADADGTWLSMNGQIVAYYYMDEGGQDGDSVIRGYIPALVNGKQSEIYVVFTPEKPEGTVTGYRTVYRGEEESKNDRILVFAEGDVIEPIADYYSYADPENGEVKFMDAYRIGEPMVWEQEPEIANIRVEGRLSQAYRITDIYGQNFWTEKTDG